MQFEDLKLIAPLLRAVRAEGYTEPTPIQEQAIPQVLAGRDLLGCAQTGTGKTAAFALPILQHLQAAPPAGRRAIRVLVLAPTRELATQIGDSFAAYGQFLDLRHAVIFGGVNQNPQVDALRRGVDILVATPGRLLDLMGQGYVRFDRLEKLVLDEADRMLDMGFIHDVRRIIAAVPRQRQTLLFSATMPPEIQELADQILRDPAYVSVAPAATTVETVRQWVYFVDRKDKPELLEHLLSDPSVTRALVFTRTKHGANKVVRQLSRARVYADAIHGNKSQSARERALDSFRNGAIRVLVATDIAARGLDVEQISHVINYDLPNEPETYVHRIGRTARAGADGIALSLCDTDERPYLADIERLIRMHVPAVTDHPYPAGFQPFTPTNLNGGARGGASSQASRSGGQYNGAARGGASAPAYRSNGNHNGGRTQPDSGRPAPNGGRSQAAASSAAAAVTADGEQPARKRRRPRRRRKAVPRPETGMQ